MSYRYNRQEIESAIELLAEMYPKCFFLDPGQRRPLKHAIVSDLIKEGVQLAPDLLRAAIDWYMSHFGYQLTLQAGVKRIDLNGKEHSPVTELEHRNAQKYVHDRRQEERERRQEERGRRSADLVVVAKPMETNSAANKTNTVKEVPKEVNAMAVKVAKPSDPLASIQNLLDAFDATHGTLRELPQSQRRFVVAGLRVVIANFEKSMGSMEENK